VATDITEWVRVSRLLEQRVADRTHELSTLLELSYEITTTEGLDYQLDQILERLNLIVDFCNPAIVLSDEDTWTIRVSLPPTNLEQASTCAYLLRMQTP
jgi:hypothetical protein